jgi:hypothetical protein
MKEEDKNLIREHLFLITYAQMICNREFTDEFATTATNKIIDAVLANTGETQEELTERIINEVIK